MATWDVSRRAQSITGSEGLKSCRVLRRYDEIREARITTEYEGTDERKAVPVLLGSQSGQWALVRVGTCSCPSDTLMVEGATDSDPVQLLRSFHLATYYVVYITGIHSIRNLCSEHQNALHFSFPDHIPSSRKHQMLHSGVATTAESCLSDQCLGVSTAGYTPPSTTCHVSELR